MMPLLRSASRRSGREGQGFATPHLGTVEQWPQRVVMPDHRDEGQALFRSVVALQ
jgi:hypothetical protein